MPLYRQRHVSIGPDGHEVVGQNMFCGIGIDSTTANSAQGSLAQIAVAGVSAVPISCSLSRFPTLGWHFYQALERTSGGTATFFGDATSGQGPEMTGTFVG